VGTLSNTRGKMKDVRVDEVFVMMLDFCNVGAEGQKIGSRREDAGRF
jgi:hypothetical protein